MVQSPCKSIPLQMFDYAGETLTDLFNNRAQNAEGAAKQYFDQVRNVFESASVLLVLLNLESLVEQGVGRATETKGTLITAMTAFLDKIKADKRDCRVCFVFTSYDRYESLIKQRWGSVQAFLEQEIPPLYYEVAEKNPNVRILAVAAVGETEARIEPHTGIATLYPKAGFKTEGFDQLVRWLIQATGEAKAELDVNAEESRQDEENKQALKEIALAWENARQSSQLAPVDRLLSAARNPFPHPHRPNILELQAQLQPVVDAASDVRSKLVQAISADRWKTVTSILKSVAMVVAVIVGGRFVINAFGGGGGPQHKAPQPVLMTGKDWTLTKSCSEGVLDCWEHRVTAAVPIWNQGGAGNITVTATVGARSESVTRFFNPDEKAWVNVVVGDLPSHPNSETSARMNYKATQ